MSVVSQLVSAFTRVGQEFKALRVEEQARDFRNYAKLMVFGFSNTEMAVRTYTAEGTNRNVLVPVPGIRPVNAVPTAGTRDPSVMQYNGKYWMAASKAVRADYLGTTTVMHIYNSDDLVTWNVQADLPGGVASNYRVWAPEWFVDDDGSVYLYYSVSTQAVAIGSVTQFDIYARKANDISLTSWGAPVRMSGISAATTAGAPGEVIDAQVVKVGKRYVMHVKDEVNFQIMRAWADSPLGPWVLDRTGNWLNITGLVEGPQLMKMPSGLWRLSYDRYAVNQLAFKESATLDGLASATEQTWSYPSTPYSDLRHLGFMWITPGEWAALRQAGPTNGVVWTTAARAVANNVASVPVVFDASAGADGMWSSAQTTRVYISETALYSVHLAVSWPPNAVGQRSMAYRVDGGSWTYMDSRDATANAIGTEYTANDPGRNLVAGSYIEMGVFQNSGGSLNLLSAAISVRKIRSS